MGREFISGEDLGKIDRGKIEEEINERSKEGMKKRKRERKKYSSGVETTQTIYV
jgi:hypothetical protein